MKDKTEQWEKKSSLLICISGKVLHQNFCDSGCMFPSSSKRFGYKDYYHEYH